jgi:hypothetical protein
MSDDSGGLQPPLPRTAPGQQLLPVDTPALRWAGTRTHSHTQDQLCCDEKGV